MRARRSEFPQYPSINLSVLEVLAARIAGRKQSFLLDAKRTASRLHPPIRYLGLENIPTAGPFQILVNHYARPGFNTAWIAIAVSAVQPAEVTWIVADQWVYPGHPLRFILWPAMHFILASFRRVYDFLPMPTMLPGYSEKPERSAAVRGVIRYCHDHPAAIIGLTPEGWDSPPLGVNLAPSGTGKFILRLNQMRLPLLPAALAEKDGCLTVKFGSALDLPDVVAVPRSRVDETIRHIVRVRMLDLFDSID